MARVRNVGVEMPAGDDSVLASFALINLELSKTPEVLAAIARRVGDVENSRSIDLPAAVAAGNHAKHDHEILKLAFRAIRTDSDL